MGGARIAIAGCGPCGLAAALLLARDGHEPVLFERFETPRPIGSGLMIQPAGLAVLQELGLATDIVAAGSRIDRLWGQAAGHPVLDVRYRALGARGAFGIGIHRASLFGILYGAVRAAGIPIHTGREVSASVPSDEGRLLEFGDGTTAGPFALVVDALGTRSPLAPRVGRALAYGALWASLDWPVGAGFDPAALEQRYRRASIMAGVLPIGAPSDGRPQAAFFWSLRADRLEAWREAGLERWKAEVCALWPQCLPLLDQIADPDQLTYASYAHRTLAKPVERSLIHIGDAWHSTSPQLGQGANMALLDAWALAKGIRETGEVEAGITRAAALRGRHVRLYQALSFLFTPVYQSDSRLLPLLRDRLVGPLSKLWPATRIQAAMVSGLIGDPLTPLGLAVQAEAEGAIQSFASFGQS